MQNVHTFFKSSKVRLLAIDNVRNGNLSIFKQLTYVPNSVLCELKIDPEFDPSVNIQSIYVRKDTQTIVYKIFTQTGQVFILKLYKIRQKQPPRLQNTVPNHVVEIRYLKLFADLVKKNVTPHFTLPIGHTILKPQDVSRLFPELKAKTGKYMTILGECGDSTFNKLIWSPLITEYQISAIIFQIIYTLEVVHQRFPSFRHNDLHMSNVLIQNLAVAKLKNYFPENTGIFIKYHINGKKFYINADQCPYRALIWDMYYSSINKQDADRYKLQQIVPFKTQLSTLKYSKKPTRSCINQYYDIHKFFDSLEYVLNKAKVKISSSLKTLIDEVVPSRLKCMSKGVSKINKVKMQLWNKTHTTPRKLLQHAYFDKFQKPTFAFKIIQSYQF
jgi:hypothetical protein